MFLNLKKLQAIQGRKYRALWTQAGTAAPTVAATKQNDLGGTPVLTRNAAGQYDATLAGAFPANKTFIEMKVVDRATGKVITGTRLSDNAVRIEHGILGGALSDAAATFEVDITVYPY